MKTFIEFLLEYWMQISPLAYELIARLYPTRWNISILDNIFKLLNLIVPNLRRPHGREIVSRLPNGKYVNDVPVEVTKHVLR